MSKLLDNVVGELSRLPGIGNRTALRLAMHILQSPKYEADALAESISRFRNDVKYCSRCNNISDSDLCPICCDERRDRSVVCVVEQVKDVISIENTGQYHGLYHVLGGVISPMDGVGPADLEIDSLVARIQPEGIKEVILALPTTMEGDTTNFYIYKRLHNLLDSLPLREGMGVGLKISQIARGVAIGNEIEYTDEITLGRSIVNRIEFKL